MASQVFPVVHDDGTLTILILVDEKGLGRIRSGDPCLVRKELLPLEARKLPLGAVVVSSIEEGDQAKVEAWAEAHDTDAIMAYACRNHSVLGLLFDKGKA